MQNSFTTTKAYCKINRFLLEIQKSIQKEPQTSNAALSQTLSHVDQILESTPLDPRPARVTNYAFQAFLNTVKNEIKIEMPEYLYFTSSFGNFVRMDYGTGHEMNFLCFTYVLTSKETLKINEVFHLLSDYFRIVRKAINKFNIEPAGSLGIWGVDDFQLLPFLLGSAEMAATGIRLGSTMGCYKEAEEYVRKTKGRHFERDATFLASFRTKKWGDVNRILNRKYYENVLNRSVVVQHFIFCEFLENERVEESFYRNFEGGI